MRWSKFTPLTFRNRCWGAFLGSQSHESPSTHWPQKASERYSCSHKIVWHVTFYFEPVIWIGRSIVENPGNPYSRHGLEHHEILSTRGCVLLINCSAFLVITWEKWNYHIYLNKQLNLDFQVHWCNSTKLIQEKNIECLFLIKSLGLFLIDDKIKFLVILIKNLIISDFIDSGLQRK